MAVPTSISDLSTTPASNFPAGSESPSTIDDYLRAHAAIIRQVSDAKSDTSHNHTGVYEPADATILKDADIGVSVQAYDVDTLKADVADTLTAPFRGTVTTDNDLSFDMDAGNNFSCTPTGTGTLTFTNITAGQSGFILLDNSGGYAISAAATTKVGSNTLTQISAAGVYLLSYFSNGTNVYVVNSGALA